MAATVKNFSPLFTNSGIPLTMGFRPQLIVVSGLFGGNPFDDGI
jgi:hypothetical protein